MVVAVEGCISSMECTLYCKPWEKEVGWLRPFAVPALSVHCLFGKSGLASLSLSGSLFFSLPLFLAFSIYLLFSFSSLLFVFFGLLQLDSRISFVQIFSSLCLFYLAVFVDFVTGTEVRSLSLKVCVLVKYRAFSVDQID